MMHQTSQLLSLIIFLWIIACSPENAQESRPESAKHTISSLDLSQKFDVRLELVDSFTYRLPGAEKLLNGRAYVFDQKMLYLYPARQEILNFDSQGKLLSRMGGQGEGPGEFTELVAIMADSNFIYGLGHNPYRLNVYDFSGTFIKDYNWSLAGHGSAVEPEFGQVYSFPKGYISPVFPCCNSSASLAFYQEPFIGILDKQAKLVQLFGQRDSVYLQSKPLEHLIYTFLAYDPLTQNILVSQQAAHFIDVYTTTGKILNRFGRPGKHINHANFIYQEEVDFDESSELVRFFRAKLIFETAMYYDVIVLDDYFLRLYRNGIPVSAQPEYTWQKPLYIQVYDRKGNLLADQKAPEDWFFPRGVSRGNHCWFAREDMYWNTPPGENRPDKFYHTVYQYQVQLRQTENK